MPLLLACCLQALLKSQIEGTTNFSAGRSNDGIGQAASSVATLRQRWERSVEAAALPVLAGWPVDAHFSQHGVLDGRIVRFGALRTQLWIQRARLCQVQHADEARQAVLAQQRRLHTLPHAVEPGATMQDARQAAAARQRKHRASRSDEARHATQQAAAMLLGALLRILI